jgi:two-component system chemotaxis sensor kinase CheA
MDAADFEAGQELYVVIVQAGDHRIGLLVDALVGQQEIVIKSLGKILTGIRQIAVPLYWVTARWF